MSKKRNRTAEEKAIHEEAVRLRKMTDRQLVEEFHRAAEPEVSLSSSHEAQDEPEVAGPNEIHQQYKSCSLRFQTVSARVLREQQPTRLRSLRRKRG